MFLVRESRGANRVNIEIFPRHSKLWPKWTKKSTNSTLIFAKVTKPTRELISFSREQDLKTKCKEKRYLGIIWS